MCVRNRHTHIPEPMHTVLHTDIRLLTMLSDKITLAVIAADVEQHMLRAVTSK